MYGLRPLGGSLDSDDEEEREFRVAARDARAALNASRLAEPPTREQARRALSGTRGSAIDRVQAIIGGDSPERTAAPAPDTDSTVADPAPRELSATHHGPAAGGAAPAADAPTATDPGAAGPSTRTGTQRRNPARSAGTKKRAPRRAKASPTTDVDLETMESRVSVLLEKLAGIDSQIAEKSANGGLAARARIKDLEGQRATVMHTLAALEKARRHQSG